MLPEGTYKWLRLELDDEKGRGEAATRASCRCREALPSSHLVVLSNWVTPASDTCSGVPYVVLSLLGCQLWLLINSSWEGVPSFEKEEGRGVEVWRGGVG